MLLFFLGMSIMSVAIFANTLGIDQHAGWSRARIGLLLFGVSIILCAILYYRYLDEVHSVVRKIQAIAENLPSQYFILPIVIIVIFIYAWFGSSGRWSIWKSHTHYYDSLARSFLNADLHLPIEPDSKLLALSNPYDPMARKGIEVPVDLSLYKGKFYMYWGPVPALILAVVYSFFHARVGDLFLTFAFVCGIFLVQTILLLTIWNSYFRNSPKQILYISISLMGLAGPLMLLRHNYESAVIYEAAITGAQFFFISGMLAALTAMAKPSNARWGLATAGILWALAIGSRQILAVPIAFVIFILALWLFRTNAWSIKRTAKLLIPLGLPLVFGFASLGWYNWARFGSITETGLYYQLAGPNLREHYNELFSQIYIFQNLYNYLFNAMDFTSKFPFVFMLKGSEIPIFFFYSLPDVYNAQPITGLLCSFPFAIFAVVPFFILAFRRKSVQHSMNDRDPMHLNLITISLGGFSLIAFGLLMTFFWAGMRYWGDVIPSLMTLSVLGFWQGYHSVSHKPLTSKMYVIFGVILASASILLSILLAISTNDGLIKLIIRRFPFL